MEPKTEQKEMPARELKFKVKAGTVENEYTIKYPNNGELIDIEVMKDTISNGRYMNLLSASTKQSTMAAFTIDMIATLNTLCPKLKDDLKVKSFFNLDIVDNKNLLNIYLKKIFPWLNDWQAFLDELPTDEV